MKPSDLSASLTLPAFKDWAVFAGGTFAAPGKYGYSFTVPGLSEKSAKIQWSISPVSRNGHHKGYSLSVFGLPGRPGHAWVSPARQMANYPLDLLFGDPRSAVAAARQVHSTTIDQVVCENLGIDLREWKKMVKSSRKTIEPFTSPNSSLSI